jgi:hypothetical protein
MGTANDMGLQELHKATRQNREADFSSDVRMQAEYKGFLAKASDADISLATNKWQEMVYSPDPKIRAQGIAGLGLTKEFLLQKQKDEADLRKVQAQGANQLAVQREANKGRVELKGMAGAGGKNTGFNPKTPEHLYAYYMNLAFSDPDPAKQEQARALANEQLAVMREKWATKGVPEGTIDPSKAGGKERPTVPTVPKVDVSRPPTKEQAAKEAPKGPTQADLEFTAKKHGLTVEQVKAKLGIK